MRTLPRGAVLVVGAFHTDSVATHVAQTLEGLGCRVARLEVGVPRAPTAGPLRKRIEALRMRVADLGAGVPVVRERFARRLIAAARREPLALTLVCHDFLMPREVDRLRDASGAPVALWFPDAISRFGRAWFLNAPYDGLFFKDPYSVAVLRRALDKPIHYLPEAFNPRTHDAPPLDAEQQRVFGCDVCTAGNLYSYRAEFFARLADFDVKIWGNPPPLWMRTAPIASMIQNRYVVNQDKARAFRAAKVCVNNLNPAEIWGLNARAFEIAGCGGFQLIDWRPALEDCFEDGRELVSFRDMDDLREKLRHYLARPDERARIAAAGRARAQRDHTFEARLRVLLDTVQGHGEGHPLPQIEMRRLDAPPGAAGASDRSGPGPEPAHGR